MFCYKLDNRLVISQVPIQGLIRLTPTEDEIKYFDGFDAKGIPIINRNKFAAQEKEKQVQSINAEFDRQCNKVGIDFEGNKFQYDDTSRSRLAETKDDARVTFWRSVDNKNIPLSNVKKNSLYKVLIETYYTKFAEKSMVIDGL
jgi:hypothetical protein